MHNDNALPENLFAAAGCFLVLSTLLAALGFIIYVSLHLVFSGTMPDPDTINSAPLVMGIIFGVPAILVVLGIVAIAFEGIYWVVKGYRNCKD